MNTRGRLILIITAVLVAVIELGATLDGLDGEPLDLIDGWAPTRAGDLWSILLTVTGSAAVFAVLRFPVTALTVSSGAYIAFILRDYEFGMTLPAMVAIFVLTARGPYRLLALGAAMACFATTLVWIAQRTATIADERATILAWVAFGTVCAVFFLLPALFGELVRLRRLIRTTPDRTLQGAT